MRLELFRTETRYTWFRSLIVGLVAFSIVGIESLSEAAPINDSSFFGLGATTIDFETFPGGGGVIPSGTALTNQYSSLGVVFSSEDILNALQTTDPGDVSGRFEDPFRMIQAQGGGGAPTSGVRYASGDQFLGAKTSDMRIDFLTPVNAFGFFLIDNDFTDVRIAAFSALGTLLETLIAPQVGEGEVTYRGLSVPNISYVIIDGNNGGDLDSSFIDDLSYTPIPEPSTFVLLLAGILGTAIYSYRRRKKVTVRNPYGAA